MNTSGASHQLNRFRRLFSELLHGEIKRNSFAPWEIDLMLDFDSCELPSRRRLEILGNIRERSNARWHPVPGRR